MMLFRSTETLAQFSCSEMFSLVPGLASNLAILNLALTAHLEQNRALCDGWLSQIKFQRCSVTFPLNSSKWQPQFSDYSTYCDFFYPIVPSTK